MASITDTMKADHQELRDDYAKTIDALDEDSMTRHGNKFTWDLARYTVAEELVIYPAIESHMDHGSIIINRDRAESQKLKQLLASFQPLSASDAEYRPTLDDLMSKIDMHINEEEDQYLPSLEAVLDPGESEKLARDFERTKVLMPTRSHPSAAVEQPMFETALALVQAPIDKVADLMRRFPQE
ncbi:HHE domain-containing protein [Nannizzia gypsea CBS 118893]|uniref:HHE domain-containing protein n=1 Tax=Arthroderma gypseum (strain ATCC MYA-4604 / CBS 118893) TaxID=535722 RepID=E5R1P1_ARTGP|nr:HHE domain-containing protein [Nannizzia gypsea CBS 118893]EFQ97739.1 HHE domain-containing protein [Nannizzia gypsea CBS 118893]